MYISAAVIQGFRVRAQSCGMLRTSPSRMPFARMYMWITIFFVISLCQAGRVFTASNWTMCTKRYIRLQPRPLAGVRFSARAEDSLLYFPLFSTLRCFPEAVTSTGVMLVIWNIGAKVRCFVLVKWYMGYFFVRGSTKWRRIFACSDKYACRKLILGFLAFWPQLLRQSSLVLPMPTTVPPMRHRRPEFPRPSGAKRSFVYIPSSSPNHGIVQTNPQDRIV